MKRSRSGEREDRQPTKKKCKKEIDKTTAKALRNSLKSIDTNILVDEVTASLKLGAIVVCLT